MIKTMTKTVSVFGIDIGSVSVAVVELDQDGDIIWTAYEYHYGHPGDTLTRIFSDHLNRKSGWIACTSSTPKITKSKAVYDSQVCFIAAAKHFCKEAGSVLVVGAEKFSLIRFDRSGNYKDCKTNTSCAAGTGSFLDQQARRLGLEGSAGLSDAALLARSEMPSIASRCAVFAKTDLLHAQQEGFLLEDICNGLCFGVAKNIIDTLFSGDEISEPIVFAGGVSLNQAVKKHLSSILNTKLLTTQYSHLFGAIGSALLLHDELFTANNLKQLEQLNPKKTIIKAEEFKLETLISESEESKVYHYEPLEIRLSDYPDFSGLDHYEYTPITRPTPYPVEVDFYEAPSSQDLVLGIDIGSTSTKAILLDKTKNVTAGFYTRTAGQPLRAVQAIFEAVQDWSVRKQFNISVSHAGTTGAGRKFIGGIIGADLVVDEITAHATAACKLNPNIDTIIEIGGQDAKFTSLKNGMVTSCTMNYVCAAGTGSFIEEQAQKLNCPLTSYSEIVDGARAPMASDCCTVFMERDINHHLRNGFSREEALAAVLHSVRENYLRKVATHSHIGACVAFQGATAKNKALVAAFEQKLNQSIHVSKYCHLTGALGVAYMLTEQKLRTTRFRGLSLYRSEIPLHSETCLYCANHCKIRIAEVGGDKTAFGFLCGRDYRTKHFIPSNQAGFDMFKARAAAFQHNSTKQLKYPITIGLPAALYLFEEIPFWEIFFDMLGIKTISSLNFRDAVSVGKRIAGAEFCAPIAAFHGHAAHLAERADYVFAPVYLEEPERERGTRRQYCYYSQFVSSLLSSAGNEELKRKCLSPLLNYDMNALNAKIQLYLTLKNILGPSIGFVDVYSAYDKAWYAFNDGKTALRGVVQNETLGTPRIAETPSNRDVAVVLIGRPYTILSPQMNKGIPGFFSALGVKTFYQDMLAYNKEDLVEIQDLLKAGHWLYASKVLESAEVVAKTPGLYPVLITSFKCAPDSCTIDYFKRIVEAHDKPYLILQLDEHDSSVGYETRIESGVRAFRNHFSRNAKPSVTQKPPSIPSADRDLEGKTLLLPNWDPVSCQFIVNNLIREGIDARLLTEDIDTIQRSLLYNTGQCLPLTAIVQGYIDYVTSHDLDPSKTALWVLNAQIACNIGQYPYYTKSLLDSYGQGFEKASLFVGEISFSDFSVQASLNTYLAFMMGGFLRKMVCKIRPYEKKAGDADRALEASVTLFNNAFLGKSSKLDALQASTQLFEAIAVQKESKPKVAIFGDLYVVDNEVMNQQVIRHIEDNGGEVVVTPYTEFFKIAAKSIFKRWMREGNYVDVVAGQTLLAAAKLMEKRYLQKIEAVLGPQIYAQPIKTPEEIFKLFNINAYNTGESFDNILKIMHLIEVYPDLQLFVQLNPSYCCPSLVTEAMAKEIERVTGVPIVSVTYDGTNTSKNDVIVPYLKYPRKTSYRNGLSHSEVEL